MCQAMCCLVKCIQLDKENLNAQIQLGIVHETLGEEDMALKIYKKIMETNPSFVKAYEYASFLLMDMEQYNEAGKILSRLIKVFPECIHAYLGMGICYEKLDNISSAKRCYRKFLSLSDNNVQTDMVKEKLNKLGISTPAKHLHLLNV